MDEQTVHPCEAVSQSGDHDSTETDESKDDDVKESSAGEKADGIGPRSVTSTFACSFQLEANCRIFIFQKSFGECMLFMNTKIIGKKVR